MRLALLSLVLVFSAGCDSQQDGDLDLGDFRGFDASIRADVGGAAFHRLAQSEGASQTTVPLEFRLGSADQGSRTVELALPLDGRLRTGTYALSADAPAQADGWALDHSATETARESSADGTVTVTEVRRRGDYADISGTVDITFPSGAVTGAFRAVDGSRPTPASGCRDGVCTNY